MATDIEIINGVSWSYRMTDRGAEVVGVADVTPEVMIPSVLGGNSVTSIGKAAFKGCIGLVSIDIPTSVMWIGDGAFTGCSGLTSVKIGDGATRIEGRAFRGCIALSTVMVASRVMRVEDLDFWGCQDDPL